MIVTQILINIHVVTCSFYFIDYMIGIWQLLAQRLSDWDTGAPLETRFRIVATPDEICDVIL